MAEEKKERKPRKSRIQALEDKITLNEAKLEALKANVTKTEEKLTELRQKLEDAKNHRPAERSEQRKMNDLLKEKGITFEQLEALLNEK